ncbi:MAG: hypothetical protein E2P02_18500 [Acidobacteria bacterium]|nr:MAG: hypothetical protein E2P02_18500 [Acidobacteriota bacterium]
MSLTSSPTTKTRLSFGEIDIQPVWTPDSQHVLYASGKNGPYDIYWEDGRWNDPRGADPGRPH